MNDSDDGVDYLSDEAILRATDIDEWIRLANAQQSRTLGLFGLTSFGRSDFWLFRNIALERKTSHFVG